MLLFLLPAAGCCFLPESHANALFLLSFESFLGLVKSF
jgi:hypothetical protein